MSKDLSILEYKDSDTPELRSLKSYWQMVMDMPVDERRIFLQEERVKEEEAHLQWMINSNHSDDEFIAMAVQKSKTALIDYEMFKTDVTLEIAELWAEIARGTKLNRFTIADIRKQRERVQWEKKKLR
jgi:hypothetical protein